MRDRYLSNYRKSEISELAEYIAETYCPDNLINPELIAKKEGISFSYNDYKDCFDGLIEHFNDKFHIYINTHSGHPYTPKARFTFGHELGHYFLDEHRNALASGQAPAHSSFTNFKSEIYTEWEADYFSACLLMPEDRFKKDCLRKKFNFSLLDEFSKKYQTSLTSTAIRFSDIGNHPLMIVFCENERIKWHWYSDDFPYTFLLHGKFRIPQDTAVGEYYSNGKVYKNTQEVWAIDWFNNVPNYRTNQKFYEHCVPYKNMAMSFIWGD